MAKPEMSIAKYACSGHNKKLFFGKPNPLIMIEDLAYRLSLQELEDILEETMQIYHETTRDHMSMPAHHPIDIHYGLVQIAMKDHTDTLYGSYLNYSASLLRKCAKLYKDTSITINEHLVKKLKHNSLNPDIKEIE